MKLIAETQGFSLDGKPFFLYSGEIHYFRVSKDRWKKHLKKLKSAGANTVSTYIPWSWHEIEEGSFDFTGKTDSQRDILGFLEYAAEEGLFVSVKPGPYILAEFEDRGIPSWLTGSHPEIQARGVDMVTYMHPVFLHYIQRWYDAILPHLAQRQITRGGNIILMQVCNEVGLYNWLEGAGDTSEVALDYFHRFLQKNYKHIDSLNQLYESHYHSFDDVSAPNKPAGSQGEFIHWNDWHDFHRWYYAEYLSWLIKQIRDRDIDIQLFHNIPGWVFGRGHEYPVNISFYSDIVRRHPEMIFGVDHIPENPNYRNQHDDLIINEMVRALQGGQKPIWAAEQQAGTREHNVHTFPNELELFYKACLGRGMTGMNFYMFSQGLNPARRGAFGPTFYWMTALGHDGSEKALYPVIKKIGGLVKTFGSGLLAAQKRCVTTVAFYRPYYHDEFYYPLFGGISKLDAAKVGLRYDPKMMRNTYYYDGLLRMLVMQNRDFDILDLQTVVLDPKKTPQLWVMALDYMDPASQAKLADYVEAGGHLLLWPGVPDKDLKMQPCTILSERLGLREGEAVIPPGNAKIDFMGIKDINVLKPIRIFSSPDAEEIAHTPEGKCCGLNRRIKGGLVTLLGTFFAYNIKEHLFAFERLCGIKPVAPALELSNKALQAHVRFGPDYALLFLLNYTPVQQAVTVVLKDVPGINEIKIPDRNSLVLNPLSGLIIPVNFPLGKRGARLRWSTCEIIDLHENEGGIEGLIQTLPYQESEMLLQLPLFSLTPQVKLEGSLLAFECYENYLRIKFPPGNQTCRLEIQWQTG